MLATNRITRWAKRAWEVLSATWDRYTGEHGELLAAAFSLYTLLALAPLAVIAVAIAGFFIPSDDARGAVLATVERGSSHEVATLLSRLLEAAEEQRGGWAAALATVLLIWAASRLFLVLQEALNAIWGVRPRPAGSVLESISRVAWKRLLSFAMVLGCGVLLLAMLALQTALSAVSDTLLARFGLLALGSSFAFVQQLGVSFLLLSVAFAVIYRVLPDAKIRWADVWLGAVFTAALVLLGTALLSLYFSRIAPAWLAGAVGSIAALLLWSYYLAQVFLLGASLTRVLAGRRSATPKPEPYAQLREDDTPALETP